MEYTIIRTNRKTTSLEIKKDGSIVIHAPLDYTDEQAASFVKREEEWIKKRLPAVQSKKALMDTLDDNDLRLLRESGEHFLKPLCDEFARKMNLKPTRVSINGAKARFGSCSADNSIRFSMYLLLYPLPAVEYVIVHELAHIVHHNHSREFHNEILKYLPDAREREKLLLPANAAYENFNKNVQTLAKKFYGV